MMHDLSPHRGGHYLNVYARLRAQTSFAQAQASMATVQNNLARDYPVEDGGWGVRVASLEREVTGDARQRFSCFWALWRWCY
jgi:hypothetical protein